MKFSFQFKEYSPKTEEVYGTILTLGNGYIGIRGEIELEPTIYGTTVLGIYDYTPYFYREIVNAPRVIGLGMMFNGEPLNLSTHKLLKYEKELDIEEGSLKTWIELETNRGARISYESLRIVHGKRKNVAVLKFKFKTDKKGLLTLINPIDVDVANPSYRPEILVRHCYAEELEFGEGFIYAGGKTMDKKYTLGIARSLVTDEKASRSVVKSAKGIAEVLSIEVEANRVYEFVNYVVISSDRAPALKDKTLK